MNKIGWIFLLLAFIFIAAEAATKMPDPYKVLGIPRDADDDQIKAGFKKRSKKYHPDRNTVDPRAKEKFEKVVNAYELLKDPQRKRIYDLTGGDEDPQQQQFRQQQGGGFGGGFPGGFGFPGGGINIEDLMRGGFFGGGHPGQQQHQQRQGGQGGQRRATYSFSFGGGEGMRFQF